MQRRTQQRTGARPTLATFAVDLGDRAAGNIVRLSAVGTEIESPWPPPVGARIVIWTELLAGEGEVAIRGRVDWSTSTRFGVQLGPLGPRETYAIIRAAQRFELGNEEGTRDQRSRAAQQSPRAAGDQPRPEPAIASSVRAIR